MSRHGSIGVAILALGAAFVAQPAGAAEIQGVVKSASGAPVTGAFVKLKNAERRLTFMVVSQNQGRYTLKNLPSGSYVVQGIGGEMQSAVSAPVQVTDARPATLDVSLTDQRAPALPNAWPGRQPGRMGGEGEGGGREAPPNLPDGPGKQIALTKCSVCHSAGRIVAFQANRERWQEAIEDMRLYMEGSTTGVSLSDQEAATLLDYIVTNFAEGAAGRPPVAKPDSNSRLPRTLVTGEAARYIAVEYEIPTPRTEPHEVTVDTDGNGWVTQRRGGKLGRLDAKTLTYTEVAPPPAKSEKVSLNAIWAEPDNKLWFLDVGPNRRWYAYDTKTKEFNSFDMSTKLRSGGAGGNTMRVHPNGTVWFNAIGNNTVIRLDPRTREFTGFPVPAGVAAGRSASPYGMAIAGDGKIWVALNSMSKMGRVDPDSGHIDEFDLPVKDALPRKGGPDPDGNVWFGLHGANNIVKIDYKTAKMTLFTPPTPDSGPYAASVDMKNNLVWVAQQQADKIARFNPKTETWTEFALANAEEDHRRLEVDQKNPNRIWWSGNDSNRIGYIELLPAN